MDRERKRNWEGGRRRHNKRLQRTFLQLKERNCFIMINDNTKLGNVAVWMIIECCDFRMLAMRTRKFQLSNPHLPFSASVVLVIREEWTYAGSDYETASDSSLIQSTLWKTDYELGRLWSNESENGESVLWWNGSCFWMTTAPQTYNKLTEYEVLDLCEKSCL